MEREDWAAGTSSRSTKLIHGGVRYLEKAVKELDREQVRWAQTGLEGRWYDACMHACISSTRWLWKPYANGRTCFGLLPTWPTSSPSWCHSTSIAHSVLCLLPCSRACRWWEVPYLFAGLKLYDMLAWYHRRSEDPGQSALSCLAPFWLQLQLDTDAGVSGAYLMGPARTLDAFPQLTPKGLKAGIVYYDGERWRQGQR